MFFKGKVKGIFFMISLFIKTLFVISFVTTPVLLGAGISNYQHEEDYKGLLLGGIIDCILLFISIISYWFIFC